MSLTLPRGYRRRRVFPGQNPQRIRCPECGEPARTSDDGVIFYECPNRHMGYYESRPGVIIPEEKWKLK